jgi:hypothetical protein
MGEIRPSRGFDFTDDFEGLGHRQMLLLVERRVSANAGLGRHRAQRGYPPKGSAEGLN